MRREGDVVADSLVAAGAAGARDEVSAGLRERFPVVSRSDALPEGHAYEDGGCSLYASCLACPLSECRYVGKDIHQRRANERQATARAMRAEGKEIEAIAEALKVSLRTVYRYLEE